MQVNGPVRPNGNGNKGHRETEKLRRKQDRESSGHVIFTRLDTDLFENSKKIT